jgi:hypothetical protein
MKVRAPLVCQQGVSHLGSGGDVLLPRDMPRRPPGGWSPDYFSSAVLYCRSVSELLEQRKQLVLIDGGDENSGRDRAESKGGRCRVGKERRSLRLVRQANITAGGADPDAVVPPRHIVNEVSERLGDSGGGMPLQPPSYVRCRPALVEGAAQRGGGEPIDARTAPRLLIGQHPQLGCDSVFKRPRGYRRQIVLDDKVPDWSWKQLLQLIWHLLTGLQQKFGERRNRAERRQSQPGAFAPRPLHQLFCSQWRVCEPGPMPARGVGQLAEVEHCARLNRFDDP